jgi:hypothetical protein
MTARGKEFSPFMMGVLMITFLIISYFMGMLIHSAIMYEDKGNMNRDSNMAWALCMAAGTGISGWMFYYGYYVNFLI